MRLFLALVLSACAYGQLSSPPPEVDKALRERVRKFYQLHVEGKFRQLDALVAEDSKDAFYERAKGKYLNFDDCMIEYSDNYTKAIVKTPVTQEWRQPRIGVMVVRPTVPTNWKLENGEWFYYLPKDGVKSTPWGGVDIAKANAAEAAAAAADPNIRKISINEVMGSVAISKQNVELSSFEPSSDEVEITNQMPGQVDLGVQFAPMKGLEVSLDKKVLQNGEKAKLSFKYNPPDPSPKPFMDVALQILQTTKTIELRVAFAVPAGSPGEPKPKGKQ